MIRATLLLLLVAQAAHGGASRASYEPDEPAAGAAGAASATETAPQPPPVHEVVVVTASRLEQTLDQVPTHTTVLDAEQLQATPALAIDDALRQVPGFSLFRRSSSVVAHPTSQGVSLRGIGPSGASRTLVLLDGVPLNDPFGGWVYWSRVPKSSVERVELVRGGGSSAWGSAALGGVIHLLTRSPADRRLDFALESGERGTVQGDLSYGDRRGSFGFQVHASAFDTGGYPVVRADQRGGIDVPADSEHRMLGLRGDLAASDRVRVTLRADAFEEERGNGTPLTGNDTEIASLVGTVDWTTAHSVVLLRALVHGQEFASTFSTQQPDRAAEVPALDQFLVDPEGYGLTVQWSRAFDSHTVVAGVEGRETTGHTHEDFFLAAGTLQRRRRAGGDESLFGVFLQDQWQLGDRVVLSLGGRFDSWRSEEGSRLETVIASGDVLRSESFPDRDDETFSPRVGLAWQLSERYQLAGSLYRSFRAPTINELFRPFRVRNDITEANAALESETLQGGEIGVRYGARKVRWSAYAFRSELDDAIANVTVGEGPGAVAPCGFVPAGGVCRQRRNLDQVRVDGLEADLKLIPSRRIELELSYLLSDPEVVAATAQPELVGRRVAQVPEHQAALRLAGRPLADLDRFELGGMARWVGEQFEDDLNERRLADYLAVDLLARWRVSSRWDLLAAVENLFDETIETGETGDGLVSIGAPRLARLGLRYAWE
jgi:outer membrane receptor protein involved in Fe transport